MLRIQRGLPIQRSLSAFAVWLTLLAFLNQTASYAQEHVVPLAELDRQLQTSTAERAGNVADIERVLNLPAAREMLQKANIGRDQVHRAVSMLSQDELSRLARQARSAERDVKGGSIAIAILALIGLVVVVIIVLRAIDRNKDALY